MGSPKMVKRQSVVVFFNSGFFVLNIILFSIYVLDQE